MADSGWYYVDGNKQEKGPISDENIRELAAKKIITDDTRVWRSGMTTWQSWSNVVQAASREPAVTQAQPNVLTQMMADNKRKAAESQTQAVASRKKSGLVRKIVVAAVLAGIVCGGVYYLKKTESGAAILARLTGATTNTTTNATLPGKTTVAPTNAAPMGKTTAGAVTRKNRPT